LLLGGLSLAIWDFDHVRCTKNFVSDLQFYFKIVLRNTFRLDCINVYEEERDSLYELFCKLDCRFNFASDLWTNKSKDRGFIVITFHYIDDT
jgi:hypothetical protein